MRLTIPVAGLGALSACSAPSGLGLPCLWLSLGFFFFYSLLRPRCLVLCVYSNLGCLGPPIQSTSALSATSVDDCTVCTVCNICNV